MNKTKRALAALLIVIAILFIYDQLMITPPKVVQPKITVKIVQPKIVQSKVESYTISKSEFSLLCKLVQAEAGNQTTIAKQRVAEVVLNRTKHYKRSITQIIYAKGIFSSVSKLSHTTPNKNTVKAVKNALESDKRIDALWFCDDSETNFQSCFSQTIEIVEKQNDMIFWRIKK